MTSLAQVIDQMQHAGLPLPPPGHPILDGKVHRFGPQKKAWYVLREIPLKSGQAVIGGAFGRWQGAENNATKVEVDWARISPEERAAAETRQRELEAREQEKRTRLARFAANRARQQWDAARGPKSLMASDVPYVKAKGIEPEAARWTNDGTLLVPMVRYDADGYQIVGLQKIGADGSKRFNRGMEKAGASLRLGVLDNALVAIVCEGYATGCSIRMALKRSVPVIVAFDAGNLKPVAATLRAQYPTLPLIFAADDDFLLEQRYAAWLADEFQLTTVPPIDGAEHTVERATDGARVSVSAHWDAREGRPAAIVADARVGRIVQTRTFENAGLAKAADAAALVGNAHVIKPIFANRGERKLTDFNDLQAVDGLDAVAQQLRSLLDEIASGALPSSPGEEKSPAPSGKADQPAPDATHRGAGRARKPKKEFPQSFWDTVAFLLDNFVLIYGDDTVWDASKRMIVKVNHLRLAYGNDAVKFWLNNPDRKMVDRDKVVFDPTLSADPATTVNLFDGFKLVPKAGACDQIVELVKFLCNDDAQVLAWVLRWLAYPLQHPGAKMKTSIIVHGDEGSGKNLFFENVMKAIYGEYGGVIGNAQIEAPFNEWASKKLFMVADEVVTRSELRQLKGKLKAMVTGDVIMINPKGMTERAEANHMNFVFLSNELQPLALDKTDRRYLVLWTPPKRDEAFYDGVARQIANGGIEAFYHFLLHQVDLGEFTEHTKPLVTDAKHKLIALGLSPAERFFREWSGGYLPLPFMCCSAMQLYHGFTRWSHLNGERFPVSQQMFGRTIERIGREQVRRAAVRYDLGSDVKQRIVYLVGDEPDDRTRQDWVEGASQLFEEALKKYRHVWDQPADG